MATASHSDRAPRGEQANRLALPALALVTLLAALGTSIANVALPALGRAFSATLPQLQWVVLSYLLAVTGAVAGAGWLADALGRRRLLLSGLALFVGASALCAAAPSLPLLVAARALQGLAAAAMLALPMAVAAEAAPGGKAGGAMGLLGAASAAGTALGPALGGGLIALAGWRALFLLCASGGAAALLLAARSLPGDDSAPVAPPRPAGRAILKLAAALAGGLAAAMLVAAVIMASLVVGPFYLAYGLAQDVARVGLIMAAGPVVVALTGVPAGQLADRIGVRPVATGGLLLMLAGCAALALVPRAAGVPGYLLAIVVTTGGYSLFQTGNNGAVMAAAGAWRGLVSGLLTLARNLGLIAGASAMAWIFASALGGASPAAAGPALIGAAMRATFAAGGALILAALAITWRAGRKR